MDEIIKEIQFLKNKAERLGILTISEMSRKEGCSPQTIRNNDAYYKENIGGQDMAVKIKERIPYEKLINRNLKN